MKRYKLIIGDCEEVLQRFPDNHFDSVVTDPPYGLSFMGKKWDYQVPSVSQWEQIIRVLKPGGFLLCFAGTRTHHRMCVNIEDAGFEIRDMIAWVYGCLSEDTEILVDGQWEPYHKAVAGRLALCYDMENDSYSWQPIKENYVYDYDDTAYRIQSDSTDQIVSKNHRCIVERSGGKAFAYAETLECQEGVPVLEDMPELLKALPVPNQGASHKESFLQSRMSSGSQEETAESKERPNGRVCGLRQEVLETGCVATEGHSADVLETMQRGVERQGMGQARTQRISGRNSKGSCIGNQENDRLQQSSMEGRSYILQEERQLQGDQVCTMPEGIPTNVSQGRVCNGTSADCSESDGQMLDENGSGSSCQPRPAGQQIGESGIVREQQRPQAVRASRYTRTDLARVEPIHYIGKVWCVKVPTGAFVVRRNGKVFVTGNSGFPKSHNISKAIDKAAGAEREVVGYDKTFLERNPNNTGVGRLVTRADGTTLDGRKTPYKKNDSAGEITEAATEEAKQWDGWGTALKPSFEPITCARKPFKGTVAANVLKHGTGGINVDGCRVGTLVGSVDGSLNGEFAKPVPGLGRFPANLIHDGSDEVLELFPHSTSNASLRGNLVDNRGDNYNRADGKRIENSNSVRGHNDSGSAARFFYCAKANKKDRNEGMGDAEEKSGGSMMANTGKTMDLGGASLKGEHKKRQLQQNTHPTVKPTDLMRYLVRLVTPPGGTVLDPYTGSGSTGKACGLEGFKFVGVELEAESIRVAMKRVGASYREVRNNGNKTG